jgi:uncharacterized membrane protein
MMMMLPQRIPQKEIVWITGIIEILSRYRHLTAPTEAHRYPAYFFFITILPQIFRGCSSCELSKADYTGEVRYLWFRVPFQLLLIGWIFFVIRP